jgi:hypothetical protein
MRYKIESRYFYGWDDAGWTEEKDGVTTPLRFVTAGEAKAALEEFFGHVKAAVIAGNMDSEENPSHYRVIVEKDNC